LEVGALQVRDELDVTFTALQFSEPNVTVAPVTKPVPVRVSEAPARREAKLGVTWVTATGKVVRSVIPPASDAVWPSGFVTTRPWDPADFAGATQLIDSLVGVPVRVQVEPPTLTLPKVEVTPKFAPERLMVKPPLV
jgi:hypothetical protein